MKKFILHTIFLGCLFVFANAVNAQRASAITDRQKILLGEQIQLELKLEAIPAARVSVTQWFNVPDTFDHLEVVDRLKIDTIDVNGTHTYIQKIIITGFDSGRWIIPALSVNVAANGYPPRTLRTQAIIVDVLPVDVSEMKDYHPIKDILDVKPVYDWWLWIAIAAAALLLLLLIVWFVKRRKSQKPREVKPKLSAIDEALQSLAELKQREGLSNKEFYSTVENIYRRYFTRTLNFDAMQTTPDELMLRLKVDIQSQEQQINFFQLIRLITAVKYAKFNPDISEKVKAIHTTELTVKYVDQSKGGQK